MMNFLHERVRIFIYILRLLRFLSHFYFLRTERLYLTKNIKPFLLDYLVEYTPSCYNKENYVLVRHLISLTR